ncbi:MAG: tRNA lysidine(34) synthetase TilS [Eubacteriales bacterium]|nr:tRNA lysidine(34) synthetase TilS [Eubacteriales bacterium]
MSELISKVTDFIQLNKMFDDCRHIVVGISGGADSVCLIMALKEYVESNKLPITLHGVHVNHGIRQEAENDEKFARDLCEKSGIEFLSYNIDCKKLAQNRRQTVEEAGRTERYRIFSEVAGKYEKSRIAVAHHKNDQAETLIMNISRGTSVKGLCGIRPVRDNIVRPLLCVTRRQIEEFLQERNQSYVTDATNYDNDYTRNSVRNVVIPYLEEHVNKGIVNNIASLSRNVSQVWDYIDKQAQKAYDSSVCTQDTQTVIYIDTFSEEDVVIRKAVIHRCLVEMSGSAKDIYSVHVDMVEALVNNLSGKSVDVAYSITAVRQQDAILLKKKVGRKETENIELTSAGITEKDTREESFNISVDLSELKDSMYVEINRKIYFADNKDVLLKGIHFELKDNNENTIKYYNNAYAKMFDYDRINHTLNVRTRQTGDEIRISKDGMLKKMKKELIDRKVPQRFRKDVVMLCSDNEVLWAVGVRRGESRLVEKDTSKVLVVSIDIG